MSKYIDLAHPIAGRYEMKVGPIRDVLGLLDTFAEAHPDQVPGQVISASQYSAATRYMNAGDRATFDAGLNLAGAIVAPDPKPTNAELIAELIREAGYDIRHNGKLSGSNALALDLDARGVKAGGDDE